MMTDKRVDELRPLVEQLNSAVTVLAKEMQALIKELRLNTKAVNEQNLIEKRGHLALLAEMGMKIDEDQAEDQANPEEEE